MKKIGIAVFALMFGGAAYLGAQEVKTDFVGEDSIQSFETLNIFVPGKHDEDEMIPPEDSDMMAVCISGSGACRPGIPGIFPKK